MKIIKRNGSEVPFDITKIITAVTKASDSVSRKSSLTQEQILSIANDVTEQCQALNRAVSVESFGCSAHCRRTLPERRIRLGAGGGKPISAGAAAVHPLGNVRFIHRQPRGQAVQHSADGGTVVQYAVSKA